MTKCKCKGWVCPVIILNTVLIRAIGASLKQSIKNTNQLITHHENTSPTTISRVRYDYLYLCDILDSSFCEQLLEKPLGLV